MNIMIKFLPTPRMPRMAFVMAMAIAMVQGELEPAIQVVDLSLPEFAPSPHVNDNPGAATLIEMAETIPTVRTLLVLEHGQVVAEYARADVDPSIPNPLWSTTKSWMSLTMGMLVQDGVLKVEETLGEIFPDEDLWQSMNLTQDDLEFRKAVTLREMLTMNSGLTDPPRDTYNDYGDGGTVGGATLMQALEEPTLNGSKTFAYLGANNILSYIVPERTNYSSPREYLAAKVWPALGISSDDIDWWQNQDGMECSYHGLSMTPTQMAKLGQLYLQGGKSNASTQLIDEQWVRISTSLQGNNIFYGYLFWVYIGAMFDRPELDVVFCAQGLGGQDICASPSLDRIVVQQRDLNGTGMGDFSATSPLNLSTLALLPTTVFVSNGTDANNPTGGTDGTSAASANPSMALLFWLGSLCWIFRALIE